MPVHALAEWMRDRERLELPDELAVAALRQLGVDRLLERGQPQLVQPPDLARGEGLVGDVRQRWAAPQ